MIVPKETIIEQLQSKADSYYRAVSETELRQAIEELSVTASKEFSKIIEKCFDVARQGKFSYTFQSDMNKKLMRVLDKAGFMIEQDREYRVVTLSWRK